MICFSKSSVEPAWKSEVHAVGPGKYLSSTPACQKAIPALVRIQVRSPTGAVTDLNTVRLVHGSQQ